MKHASFNLKFILLLVAISFPLFSTAIYASSKNELVNTAPVDALPFRIEPYDWHSGEYDALKESNPVVETTVSITDAQWLRLIFENVELGKNSYVTITSLEDGVTQKLNATALKQSNNKSAYFNGDSVELKLYVSKQDNHARKWV